MTRYRARPPQQRVRADYWDTGPLIPDVRVDGPKEVDTGLVDRFGNSIMRVQAPIGFGRDRE